MQDDKETFCRLIPAPREALERLDAYARLLAEWNEKFNLVAPSTVPQVWGRHFLDSAQLLPLIKDKMAAIADMGAGAGFPGLVLNILGCDNIHLIESIGKKAEFLRTVITELGLSATLHHGRVEDIKGLKADIVTARAVASLADLLKIASGLLKSGGYCLFPKGQKADVELTEAEKYWMFDCEKTASLSDPSGTILAIRNLAPRNTNARRTSNAPRR